ncbi:entericidin [Shimia sp. CNT1-13L.2]|nr:entericidin [Shimia sp. CNT1-13L.2]MCP9482127.1 entericidin [Shimia sp. CNT1-13L.2]
MKKTLILLTCLTLISACNTVAGIGEDVTAGAETVQSWF